MLVLRQLKKMEDKSIVLKMDENGRLTSDAELILQNLLITTNLDFKLINRLTGLDTTKILEVYLKYNQFIDKIVKNSEDTDKDTKAIEKCLDLLIEHINQIVEYQKISPSKMLRDKDLTNILRILDRLTAIKNTKINEFDKLTTSLVTITAKVKTLESIESGKIQLNTDSNYNFDSIADKLDTIITKTTKLHNTTSKNVVVISNADNSFVKYPSYQDAQNGTGIGSSTLYKYINTGIAYKNMLFYDEAEYYKIKDLDNSNKIS